VAGVVASHTRNAALWAVAVCSCLRSSDLLGLRVSDVMDGNGVVREHSPPSSRRPRIFMPSPFARSPTLHAVRPTPRTAPGLHRVWEVTGFIIGSPLSNSRSSSRPRPYCPQCPSAPHYKYRNKNNYILFLFVWGYCSPHSTL
jgi:integrase